MVCVRWDLNFWKLSMGLNVNDIMTDTSCSVPWDSNQHSKSYLQRVS